MAQEIQANHERRTSGETVSLSKFELGASE
jgi:hypothetical protein